LKLALATFSRFSFTRKSASIESSLICAALYDSMTCSRLASMDWISARTCFASACFDWTVGEAPAPAEKKTAATRALRSARKNECLGVARIETA
jgi:hypothetical protein